MGEESGQQSRDPCPLHPLGAGFALSGRSTPTTVWCFSNWSAFQNHLEGLRKPRWPGPTPELWFRCGVGLGMSIPNSSRVRLILLARGQALRTAARASLRGASQEKRGPLEAAGGRGADQGTVDGSQGHAAAHGRSPARQRGPAANCRDAAALPRSEKAARRGRAAWAAHAYLRVTAVRSFATSGNNPLPFSFSVASVLPARK